MNDEDEIDYSDDEHIQLAAKEYAHKQVAILLQEVIKDFAAYGISPEQLMALTEFYALVSSPDKYSIQGYIGLMVTDNERDGDIKYRYAEVEYNMDGLQLTVGGYEDGGAGGDSFSTKIYPFEADDALNAIDIVDGFVNGFREKLAGEKRTVEVVDCLDGMEEK